MIEATREKLEKLGFTYCRGQYSGLAQEYMTLQDGKIILIMKEIGNGAYLAHRGKDINGTHYSETEMNCDLFDCVDDIPVEEFMEFLRNPANLRKKQRRFKTREELEHIAESDITNSLGF